MITNVAKVARIYLVRLNGGSKYTGFTTNDIENRWKRHCNEAKRNKTNSVLYAAIRKYGNSAFTIKELYQSADLKHTLNVMENKFIVEHKTHVSEGGYNMTMGGEGKIDCRHTEETKQKMSASHTGKKREVRSVEHCRKISEFQTGKIHSNKSKQKMSDSAMGNKRCVGYIHSEETRKNMSEAAKGKVVTEETRRKMSESHKKRYAAKRYATAATS